MYVITENLNLNTSFITMYRRRTEATEYTIDISAGISVLVRKYSFRSLPSTQTWSIDNSEKIPSDGWLMVTADEQTAGYGTGERSWYSPACVNIYATFSTRLPERTAGESIPLDSKQIQIPQIAALSVAETLEAFGLTPTLKWVNDILLSRKKVGGVLASIRDRRLFIGIGLNVNMSQKSADEVERVCTSDPNKIPATSMLIEAHQIFTPEDILLILQRRVYFNIHRLFSDDPRLTYEVERRLTCSRGDTITIHQDDGKEVHGEFLGLSARGGVRIKLADDSETELLNGRMALPRYTAAIQLMTSL